MGRRPVQGEDGEARKGGGGEGEAAVKYNKKVKGKARQVKSG